MGEFKTTQTSYNPLSDDRPLVIFDGVCHLCNASVAFIINRDPAGVFRFAPLQGAHAAQILGDVSADFRAADSVMLVENGRIYDKSEAALRICRRLSLPWRWLWVLRLIPKGFRDWIYSLVAKNRYRWFGRSQECMIPRADWRNRFL
jgi:predicted DCC family thiol-disulfide oxidoreductase YuxK